MDINQLKYFISVTQTLNFSESARRNGITQPSISHHIADLERQLGCQLFLRTKRSVTPTEACRVFLPYAVDIVRTAEQATFKVRQMENGQTGQITIAALTSCNPILSKCLAAFARRCPDITVDISSTSGQSEVLSFHDGKYDFYFAVREMVPNSDVFDYLDTESDPLCMIFPKDHPLAGKPLDFEALRKERFVLTSETDSPPLYDAILRFCEAHNFRPNVTCRYDRAESVLLSVGAGLGISILPRSITRVFNSQDFVCTDLSDTDWMRHYVIAWRHDISNPAARHFLQVVQSLYGSPQDNS